MTREEAKKLMESHQSSKGAVLRYWSYVDKIYDDFESREKELQGRIDNFCNLNNAVNEAFKEISSRTCSDCKYSIPYNVNNVKCELLPLEPNIVRNEFGCNRYEPRV